VHMVRNHEGTGPLVTVAFQIIPAGDSRRSRCREVPVIVRSSPIPFPHRRAFAVEVAR